MPDVYETWTTNLKYFHDHHRSSLNHLIQECDTIKRAQIPPFLRSLQSFLHGLHMHHTIEDHHVFPFLAKKFDVSQFEKDHQQLDSIIEKLQTAASATDVGNWPVEFDRRGMKALLVEMKELVFPHMQLEEDITRPEKMREAFTQKEMERFMSRV
ncbi:hypothetical protein HK097_009859 [Rhizophlyctis rosea]|uniref:Hemerythrin-like domain-containing protein n=1 Tax=Rhizophlyctis rosea TaxID=64517 RepID=A0AAD5SBJ0_9FUNG|nr:hypothetical protein HK097_009859 [Rhizophlyctis rosea]